MEAVVRLWDDAPLRDDLGRRAMVEARRWEPGPAVLERLERLRARD